MEEIQFGLIWYVALLFSLTLHESGHAWAALRGGDATAYWAGQVSLDPRPHIRREPFGTVLMPLLPFSMSGMMIGWASTPYDPRWAYVYPRRAGWMALAGPGTNLLLVVASGFAIRLGIMADVFEAPRVILFTQVVVANSVTGIWAVIAVFLSILFTLNLLLFVFNLIPLPPLDGSAAVGAFVGENTARRFAAFVNRPSLSMLGIIAAWFLIGPLFGPVQRAAVNLLYPEFNYR